MVFQTNMACDELLLPDYDSIREVRHVDCANLIYVSFTSLEAVNKCVERIQGKEFKGLALWVSIVTSS